MSLEEFKNIEDLYKAKTFGTIHNDNKSVESGYFFADFFQLHSFVHSYFISPTKSLEKAS